MPPGRANRRRGGTRACPPCARAHAAAPPPAASRRGSNAASPPPPRRMPSRRRACMRRGSAGNRTRLPTRRAAHVTCTSHVGSSAGLYAGRWLVLGGRGWRTSLGATLSPCLLDRDDFGRALQLRRRRAPRAARRSRRLRARAVVAKAAALAVFARALCIVDARRRTLFMRPRRACCPGSGAARGASPACISAMPRGRGGARRCTPGRSRRP